MQLKEFRDVELFYNVAFLAKLIKRQADMTDDLTQISNEKVVVEKISCFIFES